MPFVEPGERVKRALKDAVTSVGWDAFTAEAKVDREEVEGWLQGKGLVPLSVITLACRINRGTRRDLTVLTEVTEGLEIIFEPRPLEKQRAPALMPMPAATPASKPAQTPAEPLKKGEEVEARRLERARAFSKLLFRSTVITFLMLVGSLSGYFIGERFGTLYAGLGLILPIIAGFALAVFWSLRGKAQCPKLTS